MPAVAYAHVDDPREQLRAKIGDLTHFEVFHNKVLCAIYIAPEKTAGGIIRPQTNIDEDKHQGKIGLIVKIGPSAFVADEKWSWPHDIGLDDWVYYRVSDGWAVTINGVPCRVLDDVDIKGRVPHPDQVW